jgi:histidinol-phosphatase
MARELTEWLRVAMALADAADAVTMHHFRSAGLQRRSKRDGSLVTQADLECENHLRDRLAALAPTDIMLGEEQGGVASGDGWILDPIDGTENYSRGNIIWATLIARESADRPAVAVISAPALRQRWWAVRDRGAFTIGDRRLRVSALRDTKEATLCYGGLHEAPSPRHLEKLVSASARFRCAWGWGNFWGHVQVAEGVVDAALSFGTQIWDAAAPALVVEEAGGTWSDLSGMPSLAGGTFLTSNGKVHAAILSDLDMGHQGPT